LVAAAMVWPFSSHTEVTLWVAAVSIAAAGRAFLRRRATGASNTAASRLRAIRIGVAALGVAWGVGILLVSFNLPAAPLAWITVIFAGLVAGATASLLPDPPSFHILTVTLLLPLGIAVANDAETFPNILGIVVVVVFGVAMTAFYRRAHHALVKQFATAKRLELTERAAGNERRMLDALIEGAPNAIAVVADDGRLLRANVGFQAIFGWVPAEVLNRQLNDLVVFPEDLADAQTLDQKVQAGEHIGIEVRRKRKDKSPVWVRISAAPVSMMDSRVTFVIYDDVTEARRAREAEQQMVRIIEATTDHVGITWPDGRLRYLNAAGRTMLGIAPSEDISELTYRALSSARFLKAAEDVFAALVRDGTWSGESAFVHRDGREIPVSIVLIAERSAAGQLGSLATIARDISGEVAAREALRQARDVAEEATQAKSAFLANTSHEIRTPLNGILGMVELLLDTDLAPAQRRSAELIATSGEALLATINDLLDLSKIEANQLELETIAFDLHHVVFSTVRLLMPRASEHGIELVSDLAADVPQFVHGDPHRLRQVLTNLVGNAVKFTHEGEVVLSVRRDGGDRISFSIRDTGIGIAQANIDRIFEPFRQVDASTTRQYGGTGLGLSIARRLVELMGGALRVTSTVGKGSEFAFTTAMPVAPTPTGERMRAMGLAGVRALVVDDHPINRRSIGDMLRWAGCEVEDASSADTAIAQLRSAAAAGAPFRLLVSDVQMPGRDGFQLATDIRADASLRNTRVMLLTSVGKRGDGQKSREVGVTAYMMKPVSRVELLEAAVTALRDTGSQALVTRHTISEARRRLRVLLAEDNPVNQEVASSMLQKRGHEVVIAGDGRVAVDHIQRGEKFDVILMDLQMPELDGNLATAEIRKLGSQTPIVALTANALPGERERCLAAGMNGYLSKPFKAHELFAVVEDWETPALSAPATPGEGGPPVDLASFNAMLVDAGIESAGLQMLQVFIDYSSERAPLLRQAAARPDNTEVERIAHSIKSSAGTIMAGALARLLSELEASAQAGDAAKVQSLATEVDAEHAKVVAYLKEKLKDGQLST
ncbi:MAG TPA: response regulator, partial [Gemmatimonadaceae bacterium]